MSKNNLNDLLDQKPGGIRRPKGVTLSTDLDQEKSTAALVQKSTSAPKGDVRPSKGYKIRTDIADACKLLAVREKRKLYEVMEEALVGYLRQHGVDLD